MYDKTEEEILEEILKVDSNFSLEYIKNYVDFVFGKIIDSYISKNYLLIKPYTKNDCFNILESSFIENNNKVDKIDYKIIGSLLKEFKVEGDGELIILAFTVELKLNSVGYNITSDKKVLRYLITFARKQGVKSN